ncbi:MULTISPECIES: sulfite exporter TauE/SafE family protein [Helicobacter]|mgnify:CR=1 FL=1|uniref:sulfite exporter TauE/SafE family protein n=1 Tax=Helicobacter TaxID=209 RepID=UPI00051DDFB4|nr:sulfite exporter TauE/SafE family protein [Helicobacter sp. MIT 03-1616]TLD89800.1 sulfite exporter TauE/SafE family protein [Helicobacter sp. MIT 03-1616]
MEHIEIATLASIAFFAALGHCIGMCGGIVLAYSASLPKASQDSKCADSKLAFLHQLPFHLSYHCGKITTYCILGFIIGALGYVAMPNENIKSGALLVVGALLVIYGLVVGNFVNLTQYTKMRFSIPSKILIFMRPLIAQSSKWRLFVLGLFNGLLPCGIVYYFLLTAAIAGNGVNGAIVMGIFGLTAMPSLLFLGLISASIQQKRALFLRLSAIMMIIFGAYEMYKASKMLGFLTF